VKTSKTKKERKKKKKRKRKKLIKLAKYKYSILYIPCFRYWTKSLPRKEIFENIKKRSLNIP